MLQREKTLMEQRKRIIRQSDKKFWVKFDRVINNESVKFKVWIDCNQTNNKIIDTSEIFELVSKLYPDHDEGLNNVNYHLMVDDIYERLAAAYPDTSIWIEVTNDDFGLLAKYETRTPSSLLKI